LAGSIYSSESPVKFWDLFGPPRDGRAIQDDGYQRRSRFSRCPAPRWRCSAAPCPSRARGKTKWPCAGTSHLSPTRTCDRTKARAEGPAVTHLSPRADARHSSLALRTRFVPDSPVEEAGFEPSVPRKAPGVLVLCFSFTPTFPPARMNRHNPTLQPHRVPPLPS
jgi:hypothetical protein